jgi:hypothetical protein
MVEHLPSHVWGPEFDPQHLKNKINYIFQMEENHLEPVYFYIIDE